MSHVPHELTEEFPNETAKIAALRKENAHFSKIADEYHEINRAIHRAETNVEPTDDFNMANMRKQRLALKDEIAAMLAN